MAKGFDLDKLRNLHLMAEARDEFMKDENLVRFMDGDEESFQILKNLGDPRNW